MRSWPAAIMTACSYRNKGKVYSTCCLRRSFCLRAAQPGILRNRPSVNRCVFAEILMDWQDAGTIMAGARYTNSSTQCNLLFALRRSTPAELWDTFQPTRQVGRSILIGVGHAKRVRHQCGNHGRARTRFLTGLNSTNAE
jgi:hypothetical protein